MFVPAPETGKAGDLSIETNLGGYLDRHYLPGDIKDAYYGFGDNEGLLSTIPAIATALLGVLAGEWLMSNNAPWRKVGGLLVAGGLCLSTGFLWALHFPIIKNLWTSSFVLVAGGLSLLLLALFYAVIDVLRFRAWAFFFVVIGMNAITIYCLPAVFDFGHTANFFFGGLIKHSGSLQPILAAVSVLLVKWLVLLFLFRKRVFLRV
jgi:predicted acyltransferase